MNESAIAPTERTGMNSRMRAALQLAAISVVVSCGARGSSPSSTAHPTEGSAAPIANSPTGATAPSAAELARQAAAQASENGPRPSRNPNADLPHWDWAEHNAVSGIRFQYQQDCWAHGTIAVLESAYAIAANVDASQLDLSEQAVIDCSGAGTAAGEGWWALAYTKQDGAPNERAYAYTGNDQVCQGAVPPRVFDLHWGYVAQDGAWSTVQDLKDAIASHGPIGVAIQSSDKFNKGWHNKNAEDVFTEIPNGHYQINHIIEITGWDDTKGAWHIKNSWGRTWGHDGMTWVRYGENSIGYGAVWAQADSATH